MKYSVKLLPEVLKDLQTAKKWHNKQNSNLGEDFKTEVSNEIDYIRTFPEHY